MMDDSIVFISKDLIIPRPQWPKIPHIHNYNVLEECEGCKRGT